MLRLVRSSVLSVKSNDYIDAARVMGSSNYRIITKHLLPNSLAPVIVYATITVGVIIAAEAALSFLNVGLAAPRHLVGADDLRGPAAHPHRPPPAVLPRAVPGVTVFAFILMGDALRDALDPKLR